MVTLLRAFPLASGRSKRTTPRRCGWWACLSRRRCRQRCSAVVSRCGSHWDSAPSWCAVRWGS